MHKFHTPLMLSAALATAFAASTAFAQDAATQQQKTPPPQDTTQMPPQKTDEPAKKSWEELDTDGNGNLSRSEAAGLESLAKVFAQADADGNGELTPDEYRAWFANNGNKDVPKQ